MCHLQFVVESLPCTPWSVISGRYQGITLFLSDFFIICGSSVRAHVTLIMRNYLLNNTLFLFGGESNYGGHIKLPDIQPLR